MGFVADLIRKAISIGIVFALTGGLIDATRAMMTSAANAHGLVSLGRLNRMLLSDNTGALKSASRTHKAATR